MGSLIAADTWRVGPQQQWAHTLIHADVAPGCAFSTRAIWMAPGHVSGVHRHREHELQVVVLGGFAASLVGDDLVPYVHRPGDVLRIAAGTPHAAVNLSTHAPVYAWEPFGDPTDGDVDPLPEWDDRARAIGAKLREDCAADALHWEYATVTEVFADVVERMATTAPAGMR